jgi:hypothetical protein
MTAAGPECTELASASLSDTHDRRASPPHGPPPGYKSLRQRETLPRFVALDGWPTLARRNVATAGKASGTCGGAVSNLIADRIKRIPLTRAFISENIGTRFAISR